jgi:hypothetical protein
VEVWLEMLMVDSYLVLEGYIWANIVGFWALSCKLIHHQQWPLFLMVVVYYTLVIPWFQKLKISLTNCLFGLSTMWIVKLTKLLIFLPSLILACLLMFGPTFVSSSFGCRCFIYSFF